MRREDREPGELSPGASALLHAWLASRPAPVPGGEPDPRTLVRYLAGALPAAEADRCVRQAAASSATRRRLSEVLTLLDHLTTLTRDEVLPLAAEEAAGFHGEVAAAWLELGAERARAVPALLQRLSGGTWTELLHDARERAAAAQTALRSLGRQMGLLTSQPRVAWARGAETGFETEALSEMESLDASVTPAGALEVTARLRAADLHGAPDLYLVLLVEGGYWPLARAPRSGDTIRFELEGVGSALGLPEGSVPSGFLAVTTRPTTGAGASHHTVVLPDTSATPHGGIARLEVPVTPRCDGVTLTFALSVPPEIRLLFPGHELSLSLLLSPELRQRIGSWPVAEFGGESRTCSVPCPGCPPGPMPLGVALSLEVTPP